MVFIHYVIYSLTRLESSPHVNRVGLIYWQVKKVFFIPMAILKMLKMLSYFSTRYLSQGSALLIKIGLIDAEKAALSGILVGRVRHRLNITLKSLLSRKYRQSLKKYSLNPNGIIHILGTKVKSDWI